MISSGIISLIRSCRRPSARVFQRIRSELESLLTSLHSFTEKANLSFVSRVKEPLQVVGVAPLTKQCIGHRPVPPWESSSDHDRPRRRRCSSRNNSQILE